MQLKIKKLHPDAVLPTYATPGAACFDLHAIEDAYLDDICHVNEFIPTGLAFEVPEGWALMLYSRSGHGFKHCVRLANCVGVVDADFRGEVIVKLAADSEGMLGIKKGNRIAQGMLIPVQKVEFDEVAELSDTERGTGGFGSTGG